MRLRTGYKLCSEERAAPELVEDARRAEESGFDFAAISDHFHPWTDTQGESPFVWSTIGAIAHATERIEIGTAVTCPTGRIHPAIVAQAAATSATLLPGRFWLGVGTGENLNEHITGGTWPALTARRAMLREAVHVMRRLWSGELVTHAGEFFRVETARLYSLPEHEPKIFVAAGGEASAELAATIGDGLITTSPDKAVVHTFSEAGGAGPRIAEMAVSFDQDESKALKNVLRSWPLMGIPGELPAELPLPRDFEQAAEQVRLDDVRDKVVAGADVARYVEQIRVYADAGLDHVFLHQVGRDQEPFFRFAENELLPALRKEFAEAAA
jgi:coenzyme F420-dependent glucose-6-phosphate dehydrogenase